MTSDFFGDIMMFHVEQFSSTKSKEGRYKKMSDKEISKYLENNTKELKTEGVRARLTPSQKAKLEKVCAALDITSSALIGVAIGMLYSFLVRQGKIKD